MMFLLTTVIGKEIGGIKEALTRAGMTTMVAMLI